MFAIIFATALVSHLSQAETRFGAARAEVSEMLEVLFAHELNQLRRCIGTIGYYPTPVANVASLRILSRRSSLCSAGVIRQPVAGAPPDSLTLVTAEHCVRDHGRLFEIDLRVGLDRPPCSLTSVDRRHRALDTRTARFIGGADIAYLPIPADSDLAVSAAEVADAMPGPGSPVHFVGYPGGVGPQNVQCRLDGPTLMNDQETAHLPYRMTCPFLGRAGGASGAPVFNTDGRVIGVVSGGRFRKRNRSILVFEPLTKDIIGSGPIPPNTFRTQGGFRFRDAVDALTGETIEISGETQWGTNETHIEVHYSISPHTLNVDTSNRRIRGTIQSITP